MSKKIVVHCSQRNEFLDEGFLEYCKRNNLDSVEERYRIFRDLSVICEEKNDTDHKKERLRIIGACR